MDASVCKICKLDDAKVHTLAPYTYEVSCLRCGDYSIDGIAAANWEGLGPTERQVANASSWVHENPNCKISRNDIERLATFSTPSIGERATKILHELVRKSPALGSVHDINLSKMPDAARWMGVSWSTSAGEVAYLISNYLIEELRYVSAMVPRALNQNFPDRFISLALTPPGYAYLESLRQAVHDSQIGFCAMWFDPALNDLWLKALEPAIRLAGYEPKRIDKHEHNNKIDDEIIAMIRRSRFVVADFTGQRGGVYFEAGFAKGLNMEVIWTCRADALNEVHFDTRQYNFTKWDMTNLEDFKVKLQNRIEATIGKGAWVASR